MQSLQEESKGSTSEEEPEYESDNNSDKSIKSSGGAPKLKISFYLSTQLITGENLTLADIMVESYPASRIESMELELVRRLSGIRTIPPLIDPKAEMKVQK